MSKSIALLRGINISGKNKIPMAELKEGFEKLGYTDVATYLNSGNVIFRSANDDSSILSEEIRAMIQSRFGLDIPVCIVSQDVLAERLEHAPDWWGNEDKDIYDNLIFILPPLSYEAFYHEIGEPRTGYEQVQPYKDVIFWSFVRKDYQKTNWWSKTASAGISSHITIRTANTVRKIVKL